MRQIVVAIIILINLQIEVHAQDSTKSTCGRRSVPRVVDLIIGGIKSNEGAWPWHAAIYRTTNRNTNYTCGGTLINSNSVLTAAHCVSEHGRSVIPERLSVHLGRHDLRMLSAYTKEFHVFRVIPHPSYNPSHRINDIAIIRLSTEVTFNDYIQPICLWDSNKVSITEVTGKLGTFVGWGVTETNELSDILRQAEIPVVSFGTCLSSNRDVFGQFLSDDTFCAGLLNGTGACNGDSGGSLTFEENGVYRIRGIVSLSANRKDNRDLCDSKGYALFTDVARYLTWIEEQTSHLTHHITSQNTRIDGETSHLTHSMTNQNTRIEEETSHLTHNLTNQNTEGCERKVKCDLLQFSDGTIRCKTELYLESQEEHCKIIFQDDSNTNIVTLWISGQMDVVPDLSNAFEKFENINLVRLEHLQITNVERSKLTSARKISELNLSRNRISELAADTFNDVKLLETLWLSYNQLKVLHRDVFKELRSLTYLWLQYNRLEVLPEDIFRNKQKLEAVDVSHNNLKIILIDFQNLPSLLGIDLRQNECINEECSVGDFCRTSSMSEMQIKIRTKCSLKK